MPVKKKSCQDKILIQVTNFDDWLSDTSNHYLCTVLLKHVQYLLDILEHKIIVIYFVQQFTVPVVS